jgi:predicted 3-demethylubiquinone-9 3-methyltransferase (glyoxalase superfamily)
VVREGRARRRALLHVDLSQLANRPRDDHAHGDPEISLSVLCDTQAEIDKYWNALLQGGTPEECGWLKDKYGVSWQVQPKALGDMMADPDRARAKRVADAMLKMKKIDLAALRAAYDHAPVGSR